MDEREQEEEARIRRMRRLTDRVCRILVHSPLSLREACDLKHELRTVARRLFPDRVHVFDLVIAPRLRRLIRERFLVSGGREV